LWVCDGEDIRLKRAWLSWSSGKDSAWALHQLRKERDIEVVGLLTTFNGSVDRVAMHGVHRRLVEQQARSVGLPLHLVNLPDPCSNAEYERLMAGALAAAKNSGVTQMAFGDLFLQDVRAYRERQLSGTGIDPVFPIWGTAADTPALARRMIAGGVRSVITCVDTQQLDPSFLGREVDSVLLAELPVTVDPCGERGEFHTFCYDGPEFREPVLVVTADIVRRERFHFIDLQRAITD